MQSMKDKKMSADHFPGPGVRALRLQVGAQSIAAYESAGTGRPIVLIHGNSASSRVWQKQLEGPLGAKYRLIAIDLPGHGDSAPAPHPEKDYSAPGYSACIVDLGYLQRLTAPTLWRGEVQVIEGSGHTPQWEQPEKFEKLLDAFASSL